MNKRQKKKMLKKCLPVIADEYPLCTMNEKEYQEAMVAEKEYRLKYGYRKKYSNLKKEKFIRYFYSYGKENEIIKKVMELGRARRSGK